MTKEMLGRKLRLGKIGEKRSFFFDEKEVSRKFSIEFDDATRRKEKRLDCESCPLDVSKYVPGFGARNSGIHFWGRDPGAEEVRRGKPFVGKSGELLRGSLSYNGFELDTMGYINNICQCQPPNNVFSKRATNCCYSRVESEILNFKPKLIVSIGREATERILGFCPSIEAFRCTAIPSYKYNAIVFPIFHPAYILRMGKDIAEHDYHKDIRSLVQLWWKIQEFPDYVETFLKDRTINYRMREIKSISQFRRVADLIRRAGEFSIDFENNTAKVYTKGSELFLGSLAVNVPIDGKIVTFSYWFELNDFYKKWTSDEIGEIEDILIDLCTDKRLVKHIQNSKHEDNCLRQHIGCKLENPINCTMINEHVVHSRARATGLAVQAMKRFGIVYKYKSDAKLQVGSGEKFNRIKEVPLDELVERCCLDTVITLNSKELQGSDIELFTFQAGEESKARKNAIPFLMKGIRTFTNYEQRGIRIDMDKLQVLKKAWTKRKAKVERKILEMPTVARFARGFSGTFNLNSYDQIRTILFGSDFYNLTPLKTTPKGAASTDEETITYFAGKNTFCRRLTERNKLTKLLNTYLQNIELYIGEDGRLHPDFWLHLASTYRSSSSKPNFHNFPKRYDVSDKLSASTIREVFIPSRDDGELWEVDYSQNELKGLWMLSRDEDLLYDLNSGMDIHRYWASKLFGKSEEDVTRDERQIAKNKFVFPTVYGASYRSISDDMGMSASRVEDCQNQFFDRYWRVKDWQLNIYETYRETGYVDLPTGFRREGPLDWTQIINTPIQGTSFHLLLNACIEVEKIKGFEAVAVAQIHDSILFDGPIHERDRFIEKVNEIMLTPPWPFAAGIKLEVEWQIGKNWKDMTHYKTFSKAEGEHIVEHQPNSTREEDDNDRDMPEVPEEGY